nr:hypothetical protein [Tanacetum cinerariifolium]
MGYYFYFLPENKILVARYVEFFEKSLISQEVSGRAVELKEIQDEDTSPSKNTSGIPIEAEGFEPPQEEVIPICRNVRTHRASDCLCLNVEVEAGTVDWKSSKQSTTGMSATESEYIVASEATMEAVYIRKFILGLGTVPTINEPIRIFYDNSATLLIANEPGGLKGQTLP